MVVYIEVIMLINFIFDSCLLFSVDLLLKRNAPIKKVFLGALVGEISMLTMLFDLNTIYLFIFKILLSALMCIVTFGYKDERYTLYNVVHLYFTGIILGGFITYLYNEFQIHRDSSIRYLIILLASPIILIAYNKIIRKFKTNYNNRFKVILDYDGGHFEGIGYLDSGNKLISPISGKPIILIEKEYIQYHKLKLLPVPYNALNHTGLVNCFKPTNLIIGDKKIDNILIGLSDVKFNIDGVNVLLNARMEGL